MLGFGGFFFPVLLPCSLQMKNKEAGSHCEIFTPGVPELDLMLAVICSLLINMNSSAIQKCLSSNGLSPGQTQGCSHLCVMMWQGGESEQSRLTPRIRGSAPSHPAFLTRLAPQCCSPLPSLFSSLADLHLVVLTGAATDCDKSQETESASS